MTIEFHQGQSLQKMSLDSDSDVCEAASVLLGNIHTFLETMDARYDQNCPAVVESTVSSFRKTISLFGRTGHARFRRGNPHPEVPRHEEAAKTFLETCSQDSTCTEATRTTNSDDGHVSSSSSSRSLLPLHPHPLVGGSRFSAFSVFKPTRRSPSSSPSSSRSANLERQYFELGPIPSYEAPASEPSIPDPSFHGSSHSSSFLSGLTAPNSQPSHQQKEFWCLYQPESVRPSTFRIIKPSTTRSFQLPFSNTINHSSSLPVVITHPFPSGEVCPSNSQPTHSEPTHPAFNQPTDTLPQLPGKRKYSAILNQEQPRSPIPKRPNPKPRKSKVRRIVRVPAISSKIADIPADEYSWRKYGQKSIKGSLHPRGYYKCSSGQGCTARKHVERAMDDPSMLIVTYEDEHTHPTLPESRLAK